MKKSLSRTLLLATATALAAGCAVPAQRADYSAFRESNPKSILVLLPLNESPDTKATYSMLSQATLPLAEAGYYVLPVTLADETFRQNGLTVPGEIHAVAPAKLRQIFGADSALYVTVTDYGTKYMVLSSTTVVSANAKLVDLRTGKTLWTGSASAASDGNSVSGGGLLGALVSAAINQVVNTLVEKGHDVAGITAGKLLSAGQPGGLPYGPRSPKYGSD